MTAYGQRAKRVRITERPSRLREAAACGLLRQTLAKEADTSLPLQQTQNVTFCLPFFCCLEKLSAAATGETKAERCSAPQVCCWLPLHDQSVLRC